MWTNVICDRNIIDEQSTNLPIYLPINLQFTLHLFYHYANLMSLLREDTEDRDANDERIIITNTIEYLLCPRLCVKDWKCFNSLNPYYDPTREILLTSYR